MVEQIKKVSFMLLYWCCLFGFFSMKCHCIDVYAEEVRIEQVQSVLPSVKAWFYFEGDLENQEVEFTWNNGTLLCNSVRKGQSEEGTQYYFLVDCSTSTSYGQIREAKKAISEFAQKKGTKDQITLITFGLTVDTLLNRETDLDVIEAALDTLEPNQAGTVFFDAIAEVAKLASEETLALDRKLLFIFSDSVDYNVGGYTKEEVQQLLTNAKLPLYAVGFDNGSKENLDNFGALARISGGEITIVNEGNLKEKVTELLDMTQSEVWCANFTTPTNQIPTDIGLITLQVEDQTADFTPVFRHWEKDTTAPTIISVKQLDEKSIKLVFSEVVEGANYKENYIVKDGTDTLVGIEAVAYEEETNQVVLTFTKTLIGGTYSVQCKGIHDVSMEKNPVSDYVNVEITQSEVEESSEGTDEGEVKTHKNTVEFELNIQKEEDGAPIIAWIVVALILSGIITAILLSRKKKVELLEQEHVTPQVHQVGSNQASGQIHFVGSQKSKEITLEISNLQGTSKRVTVPINKTLFVGRNDICDLVFDDLQMSRQHFVIEETDAAYTITNLSESSNTYLNGVPIRNTRSLRYGDKIEAGAQTIVFVTTR